MATGTLKLELQDVRRKGIQDHVLLELASQDRSKRYKNTVFVQSGVEIKDIECDPFALYLVTVFPSNYRPSQFFITLRGGQTVTREPVRMPVDAGKVTSITAPPFEKLDPDLQRVLQASNIDTDPGKSGPELYTALDPLRKACLLNIFTKASNTILRDGRSCFSHLAGLLKLRGDRFFAKTGAALREEVQNARDLFTEVNGALHHPPDGFTPAKSFKTKDRFGNLQVSFFRRGETGDDYLVDVDIDEASGIEHGFEVLGNHLTGHETSPFDVREILLAHQSLDPGYGFQFGEQASITSTTMSTTS
jgi:hypothetical protein